jgi:hypothetical protein
MSFRGRLFIFFTIIVIVPMAAVAVVLFKITSDSETGKSDSRIAQGLTTALAVYQADVDRAEAVLTQVARDPKMSRALAKQAEAPVSRRARQILKARPDIAAMSGRASRICRARLLTGFSPCLASARLIFGSRATCVRVACARSTSA